MPRCRLFLILLLCCLYGTGLKLAAAPPQYAFRVLFKDKAGAPPLSSAPAWLSARAMTRRAAFGILLDSTDRPVSPRYIDTVLSLTGGKLHNTSRWLNQCVVLLTDSSKISLLAGKPWITGAVWVGYFSAGLHKGPAPDSANSKFNIERAFTGNTTALRGAGPNGSRSYYGASYDQVLMVHGDTLHDQGYRGRGKLIAVLDEGFDDVDNHFGFDSLRNSGRLLETYNFVRDTSFVYEGSSHGTSCLSTMAGLVPGSYVGTAPDALYALYTTEDGAFTDAVYELDNLVAGMERADSIGADVISSSLGYNTFVSPVTFTLLKSELDGHTTQAARAVNLASAKGIVYVVSAGNEDGNGWNYIVTPADADSALTIGAVTPARAPASFSSPGPNAAGRIKPDVCLQGQPAALFLPGNVISASSGTSFACPQAAGYVACLLQAFPGVPPAVIRQAIDSSADARPPTPKLGFGIPDFGKAQRFLASLTAGGGGSLQVAPNPFRQSFSITLPKANSISDVHLYDALGRSVPVLQERTGAYVSVSLGSFLLPGLYILSVTADGQRYIQKMAHF